MKISSLWVSLGGLKKLAKKKAEASEAKATEPALEAPSEVKAVKAKAKGYSSCDS